MSKKNLLISWLTILVTGLIAFSPIRLPDFSNEFDTPNRILVSYQSCTCCPSFRIEKGKIKIPEHLKHVIKNRFDVTVAGNTPLNVLDDDFSLSTYYLLISNNFILEGKVTDVDSSECETHPLFTVNKWTTEKYYARYLTWGVFEFLFIILYPIILLILLIFSFLFIIRHKIQKQKL